MTRFEIDDYVVVPELGLGMIIGETSYQDTPCFEIRCRDVVLKRPKNFMEKSGVRRPCTIEDLHKVLVILRGKRAAPQARNSNELYKKYREQLNSSDIFTLAKLVRNLYTKDAGELSMQRVEIYDKALRRLTDEVVFVLQVSGLGARGIIESLIDRKPPPPEWQEKLKTP